MYFSNNTVQMWKILNNRSQNVTYIIIIFHRYGKNTLNSSIILLYCIVMYCELFEIYCAPPNLGIIGTWICRLNFAQKANYSGLRFFNHPEISDSGPPASGPEKIHWPQLGLNPRILDLEASTLPRDHRGRLISSIIKT